MNMLRAVIALGLSGYFFWYTFGPKAVQGHRALYYGLFGGLLLVLGLWRLILAFREAKARV
jgi:hypothetical protein